MLVLVKRHECQKYFLALNENNYYENVRRGNIISVYKMNALGSKPNYLIIMFSKVNVLSCQDPKWV